MKNDSLFIVSVFGLFLFLMLALSKTANAKTYYQAGLYGVESLNGRQDTGVRGNLGLTKNLTNKWDFDIYGQKELFSGNKIENSYLKLGPALNDGKWRYSAFIETIDFKNKIDNSRYDDTRAVIGVSYKCEGR